MKRPFFRPSEIEDAAAQLWAKAIAAGVDDQRVIELQDVVDFALDGYQLCLDQPLTGQVLGCTSFHERKILVSGVLERQPGRMRFTIAHEMGHVVLHTEFMLGQFPVGQVQLFDLPTSTVLQDQNLEWQANAFAGAFLVPQRLVLEAYAKRGEEFLTPPVVAEYFGVSQACAGRRLKDLGLLTQRPPPPKLFL